MEQHFIEAEKDVFSIFTACESLKLGPPLNIKNEALKEGLEVYYECLEEVLGT